MLQQSGGKYNHTPYAPVFLLLIYENKTKTRIEKHSYINNAELFKILHAYTQ